MHKAPVLIFIHTPKTGGSSAVGLISSHYPAKNILDFLSLAPRRSADSCLAAFLQMTQQERDSYDFIYGHMPYGIHQFLSRRSVYINLWREPMERILSDYGHRYRDSKSEKVPYWVVVPEGGAYTLEEHMRQTKAVRHTSFIDFRPDNPHQLLIVKMEKDGKITQTEENMERAKDFIQEQFMLVGLTERHTDFVFLLSRMMGWKLRCYLKRNQGSERPQSAEMKPDILAEIQQQTTAENDLYRHIDEQFQRQWAALGIGAKLQMQFYRFSMNVYNSRAMAVLGQSAILRRLFRWYRSAGQTQNSA